MTILEAKKLLEMNNIFIEKNYIKINGEKYNKYDYYHLSSSIMLKKQKNMYIDKKSFSMRLELIYALFLMNVSEFKYYGTILPLFVFLINALISFSLGLFLQNGSNFGLDVNFEKSGILMCFLGLIFMLCFAGVLVDGFLLKNYCFYARINSYPRYYHMSRRKFQALCKQIEEEISKKSLIFSAIESDRLIINELKSTDSCEYFGVLSDPSVHKYLFSKPFSDELKAGIAIQTEINNYFSGFYNKLAIRIKETGELIGYIGLSKMDYSPKTCQIVYALGKKYWNNGYMTEALQCFINKIKTNNYDYIIIGHIRENEKSKHVIEKCGFARYELKDYSIYRENVEYDIVSYIMKLKKEEVQNVEN